MKPIWSSLWTNSVSKNHTNTVLPELYLFQPNNPTPKKTFFSESKHKFMITSKLIIIPLQQSQSSVHHIYWIVGLKRYSRNLDGTVRESKEIWKRENGFPTFQSENSWNRSPKAAEIDLQGKVGENWNPWIYSRGIYTQPQSFFYYFQNTYELFYI